MDAYLDLMYRLWAAERVATLAHLRYLARFPDRRLAARELLGEAHFRMMQRDYEALLARRRIIDRPDRYQRLQLDLDAMFLRFYARVLDD